MLSQATNVTTTSLKARFAYKRQPGHTKMVGRAIAALQTATATILALPQGRAVDQLAPIELRLSGKFRFTNLLTSTLALAGILCEMNRS